MKKIKMNFEKLWEDISLEIKNKLTSHEGLKYFAKNRAKFEGWLKVELCDILSKHTDNIIPEKDRIDIVVEDWAIELKTINTNYRCENSENKIRPITKNILGVIKDIKQLKKNKKYKNKAVAFIVFPLPENTIKWQRHINKIEKEISELKHIRFTFRNKVPAAFYLAKI